MSQEKYWNLELFYVVTGKRFRCRENCKTFKLNLNGTDRRARANNSNMRTNAILFRFLFFSLPSEKRFGNQVQHRGRCNSNAFHNSLCNFSVLCKYCSLFAWMKCTYYKPFSRFTFHCIFVLVLEIKMDFLKKINEWSECNIVFIFDFGKRLSKINFLFFIFFVLKDFESVHFRKKICLSWFLWLSLWRLPLTEFLFFFSKWEYRFICQSIVVRVVGEKIKKK